MDDSDTDGKEETKIDEIPENINKEEHNRLLYLIK